MVRQSSFFAALFLIGAACSGCACGVSCSTSDCGSGCKSPYAFMKYDACCETCGPDCGEGCGCGQQVSCGDECTGGAGCAGECKCGRKLRWFGSLLSCAGCGEWYFNEWYNDPPSCAEPCDCCGNWIGPGHECTCCSPKPYCCGNGKPGCGCYGQAAEYEPASSTPPLEVAEPAMEPAAE